MTTQVYRHLIIAGGNTTKGRLAVIGHYDYTIVSNSVGETVSESKGTPKMYDSPKFPKYFTSKLVSEKVS